MASCRASEASSSSAGCSTVSPADQWGQSYSAHLGFCSGAELRRPCSRAAPGFLTAESARRGHGARVTSPSTHKATRLTGLDDAERNRHDHCPGQDVGQIVTAEKGNAEQHDEIDGCDAETDQARASHAP